MFVEVHVLQNFALSNLNRDDTGAPKDCEFGGYRRARISSQCTKRSIRSYFRDEALLSADNLSVRTKHLVKQIAKRLAVGDRAEAEAISVARAAVSSISLKLKEKDKTEYLLFVGNHELDALATVCLRHWEPLLVVGQSQGGEASTEVAATTETKGRKAKKDDTSAAQKALAGELLACLDGGQASDLALFGRMIANKPEKNIDAAVQVAHAMSTNRVSMEFDFYTAVDDIDDFDPEASGAGMMGTVQYNSSCYYRYANLDVKQLMRNLSGNQELVRSTVAAFLEASILAVPTGKQTGTAAQNPPSFAMVVVRDGGLWSLANAFVKPVRPDGEGDMVQKSIQALLGYWAKLEENYGGDSIRYRGAMCLEDMVLKGVTRETGLRALVRNALEQIAFQSA
jgi:CRISPR system Cascade subunit CasC